MESRRGVGRDGWRTSRLLGSGGQQQEMVKYCWFVWEAGRAKPEKVDLARKPDC